jgi:translation initiation factor 1
MDNSRRVYSTESGRIRPPAPAGKPAHSGPPLSPAPQATPAPQAKDDGVVRILRERGGRNGKVVTVIRGLPARDLEARATEFKRLCGAGGAVKDGAVEVQGDHRERIALRLRGLGYTAKLAGG